MTKFNPLQILINGFNKLVSTVKRNGALTSLWAVVMFILLYTLVINPIDVNDIIMQANKQKDKQHAASVDKRLIADAAIPEILDKLRIKYNLERVSLLELHNSTSNINDVSFLFMSMTYESIDAFNDSIQYVSDQYQQTRTSEYREVIQECTRRGYLYLEEIEKCDNSRFIRLTRKMVSNGTHSVLFVPIFVEKRIDAILVLSSTRKSFDYQSIILNLNKPVSKIRDYIK